MADPRLDDDDALDALVRDAVPAHLPPAGFADRVVDARPPRRRLRTAWPLVAGAQALALAACVAALVLVERAPDVPPASGAARADGVRVEAAIGARGVAVLEPGAALSWVVDDDGGARVELAQGEAFFRVERGGPFVVATPAGTAAARGTCFSVSVQEAPLKKNLLSGAAGAVVGALVAVVVVHEGSVALASGPGEVVLAAGEQGRAAPGAAPVKVARDDDVRRLVAERDALERLLKEARVQGGAPAQVVAENERLQAEVAALEQRLAEAAQQKKELGGDEIPFPDDLPPRFAQQALLDAFQAAIKESGSRSEITSIDCTEYPCIVYGTSESHEEVEQKIAKAAALQPYADDSKHMRGWSTAKDGPYLWGLALKPRVDDEAGDDVEGARLQQRFRQMVQASKPR